jgi:hypothetical protein
MRIKVIKKLMGLLGVLFLVFVCYYVGSLYYYTHFNPEGQLISISVPLLQGLHGGKYAVETEQRQMINAQIAKLKRLIKEDRTGTFADDAQYLITVLMFEHAPEKQKKELEFLLENYPKVSLGAVTVKFFAPFIQKDPNKIRKESVERLCQLYTEGGRPGRLQALCK